MFAFAIILRLFDYMKWSTDILIAVIIGFHMVNHISVQVFGINIKKFLWESNSELYLNVSLSLNDDHQLYFSSVYDLLIWP